MRTVPDSDQLTAMLRSELCGRAEAGAAGLCGPW